MAYSQIAKPGSKFGPCRLLRKCDHKDCAEMWKVAYEECPLCSLQIGFERNFCNRLEGMESARPYVHFACAEDWVNAQRAKA
jgi:hypothetical protein